MPRVVDVEARRAALIEATSREIAERGLANVTLRSVARVNGWTTGIVTHYFADKDDLLAATFVERADRSRRQIDAAVAAGAPLLAAAIEAALPLDDERALDWRVYLAFMGASLGEPRLTELLAERTRSYLGSLEAGLAAERDGGRLRQVDVTDEARRLHVLVHGVATLAVLAPADWAPSAQLDVVRTHLGSLRPTEGRTRTTNGDRR